jgi:hypothetical protein
MRSAPATPIAPPNNDRPASVTTERLDPSRLVLAAPLLPLIEVPPLLRAGLRDPVPELLGCLRALERPVVADPPELTLRRGFESLFNGVAVLGVRVLALSGARLEVFFAGASSRREAPTDGDFLADRVVRDLDALEDDLGVVDVALLPLRAGCRPTGVDRGWCSDL